MVEEFPGNQANRERLEHWKQHLPDLARAYQDAKKAAAESTPVDSIDPYRPDWEHTLIRITDDIREALRVIRALEPSAPLLEEYQDVIRQVEESRD